MQATGLVAACPHCGASGKNTFYEVKVAVSYNYVEPVITMMGFVVPEDRGEAMAERPGPPRMHGLDMGRYQCARCGEFFDKFEVVEA